jgi:hypothetical protein
VNVVFGKDTVRVRVVRGGSMRMQPLPLVWTQYQNVELSVDAFHARDALFAVVAVIRRLAGVVGGVRSRAAEAGVATSTRPQTSAPRIPIDL